MNLAIDVGSCGFRAGVQTRPDVLNEPSVVAYGQAPGPLVGQRAEQMIGRHPGHIRIAFPVEGSIVRDFEALVDVFKYMIATLLPGRFRKRFDVVLAHPSHQSQVDRKAFDEAAKAAGARRVRFVEAVLAAARGAGLPIDQPVGSLIVDLGGGATQVALISLGGVVERRTLNFGGRAIDQELVDRVQRRYAFAIGLATAERLKRMACQHVGQAKADAAAVSAHAAGAGTGGDTGADGAPDAGAAARPDAAHVAEQVSEVAAADLHRGEDTAGPATFTVRGRNLATGLPDSLAVPMTFVQESLEQYADQVLGLVRETMEACPPELVGDVMDRGIVLVGGGAQMASVLETLRRRIDVPVTADPEPQTCVIRGLLATGS